VRVHRDTLSALTLCLDAKKNALPAYANIGVSGDGKWLHAADGKIAARGTCRDVDAGLPNAALHGGMLRDFLRMMPRVGVVTTIDFSVSWDNSEPMVLAATPWSAIRGIHARGIHLVEAKVPSPDSLLATVSRNPMDNRSMVSLKPELIEKVGKAMKPFGHVSVFTGVTARMPVLFSARRGDDQLDILVRPEYVGDTKWL
jgi:hypothetical protein